MANQFLQQLDQFMGAFNQTQMNQATGMQVAGVNQSMAGVSVGNLGAKISNAMVQQAADYNSAIMASNYKLTQNAQDQQANRLMAAQQGQMGGSGFAATSKSYLQINNESLNALVTRDTQMNQNYNQSQQTAMFEAKTMEYGNSMKAYSQLLRALGSFGGASVVQNSASSTNAAVSAAMGGTGGGVGNWYGGGAVGATSGLL